jgi:rubrerythrin
MPLLDIDQLLEFAIKLEDKGEKFYLEWAGRTDSESVRAFFRMIAEEENLHKVTFEELRAEVNSDRSPDDLEQEYEDYFRTFADYIVFSDSEMRTARDLKTAIELAKKQELDTILFYSDLKKFLAEEHRDLLDRLVKEERGHFVKLSELQKRLDISE